MSNRLSKCVNGNCSLTLRVLELLAPLTAVTNTLSEDCRAQLLAPVEVVSGRLEGSVALAVQAVVAFAAQILILHCNRNL